MGNQKKLIDEMLGFDNYYFEHQKKVAAQNNRLNELESKKKESIKHSNEVIEDLEDQLKKTIEWEYIKDAYKKISPSLGKYGTLVEKDYKELEQECKNYKSQKEIENLIHKAEKERDNNIVDFDKKMDDVVKTREQYNADYKADINDMVARLKGQDFNAKSIDKFCLGNYYLDKSLVKHLDEITNEKGIKVANTLDYNCANIAINSKQLTYLELDELLTNLVSNYIMHLLPNVSIKFSSRFLIDRLKKFNNQIIEQIQEDDFQEISIENDSFKKVFDKSDGSIYMTFQNNKKKRKLKNEETIDNLT